MLSALCTDAPALDEQSARTILDLLSDVRSDNGERIGLTLRQLELKRLAQAAVLYWTRPYPMTDAEQLADVLGGR